MVRRLRESAGATQRFDRGRELKMLLHDGMQMKGCTPTTPKQLHCALLLSSYSHCAARNHIGVPIILEH